MSTEIKSQTNDRLVIEVTAPLGGSTLESELNIEQTLNQAESVATGEALKRFDTDGSSIGVGSTQLTL